MEAKPCINHIGSSSGAAHDYLRAEDGTEIRLTAGEDGGLDAVEGWSRLIAAAPGLLAACEAANYWLEAERDNPGQCTPDEILRVLSAAIAKARGSE